MDAISGQQRIGSYRIVSPLGAGGMSSVFRAVHVQTGHEVALKVLTRSLAKNPTLLHRFLREAKSAETLVHPNIVTIFDRGIDQGRHYLALEYVSGGDLHEYVQRRGPLSVAEATAVVKSVAAGLEYAAGRGLIHRDIKPSNLLRSSEGEIKIIDLGLALRLEFEDERVTREGTTVGTVDYMAPEQARDSRAAGIPSDIYSLGCTFYYLLTGVPPYPGGDITDKLTRHARSAAPLVTDLRPDVPPQLASLIHRMMAKQPEDRFATYKDLMQALDEVPMEGQTESPGVALAPLDEEDGGSLALQFDQYQPPRDDDGPTADLVARPVDVDESLEYVRNELALEPSPRFIPARPSSEPVAPLPRLGASRSGERTTSAAAVEQVTPEEPVPTRSCAATWMIASVLLAISFVALAVGITQFWGPAAGPNTEPAGPAAEHAAIAPNRAGGLVPSAGAGAEGITPSAPLSHAVPKTPPPLPPPAEIPPPAIWVEPEDDEGSVTGLAGTSPGSHEGSKHLPEWARLPIPERIDGPLFVVRRVALSRDLATVPTLQSALDRTGGTVELADEGPLYEDDLRVSGDSRLVRASAGCRPVVRIEGTTREAVREKPAVFVLEGKNLILDGIDFVIKVADLPSTQTALFSCQGASLTLRNCSLTILNPRGAPFAIVRAGAPPARPTRVRWENTLVRGQFSPGIELADGPADVVLVNSVMLGDGGPLLRDAGGESASEHRIFLIDSVLAGPGPIFERATKSWANLAKPLAIKTYGSAFGRFHGVGIASVISSANAALGADKQIAWSGDHNLYAGWLGFFACGKDHTVTVSDLSAVRSTWGPGEAASQEIYSPWPEPAYLSGATPAELLPFLPRSAAILSQVARPRAGLFEKTVAAYPPPVIPQPPARLAEGGAQLGGIAVRGRIAKPGLAGKTSAVLDIGAPGGVANRIAADGTQELTFDTRSPLWNGDLGAFLHEQLAEAVRKARVLVVGSGPHRWTPVRLPRGLLLELRVQPLDKAEPLSFSPQPQASGRALIELEGGALSLEGLVLRHEQTATLEHLIHVEDGHLVLFKCQLTAPAGSGEFRGDLIEFDATSTQPVGRDRGAPLFSPALDRPVCRLDESVLITSGTALRANLGRGLLVLVQCAVSSGDAAVELVPARVARARFLTDLVLDHCTITSERSIIRMGPWPGLPPGPDRPWLITSSNCAFLAMFERRSRVTALLRSDAESLAHGVIFWQAANDAADVDLFAAAGEGGAPTNRPRDVQAQWVHFWGDTHMSRISGPHAHGGGNAPSVRFLDRLRPGRVEPADLILDPAHHPGRTELTVGADLARQGITPRAGRYGRQRR